MIFDFVGEWVGGVGVMLYWWLGSDDVVSCVDVIWVGLVGGNWESGCPFCCSVC